MSDTNRWQREALERWERVDQIEAATEAVREGDLSLGDYLDKVIEIATGTATRVVRVEKLGDANDD